MVGNGTYGQVYKVSPSMMLLYPLLLLFSLCFLRVNKPKQINKLHGIGKFQKEKKIANASVIKSELRG